jgi:hypothetical protein
VLGELELRELRGVRDERQPVSEEDRDDPDLYLVHQAELEEAAEQAAAAEQPDRLARLQLERAHRFAGVVRKRRPGAVARAKRGREHVRLHAGHAPSAALLAGGLVRLAAEQHDVEPGEQLLEVDLGVHHDPVGFALRAGDVAVQADGHGIAHRSHGSSSHPRRIQI